MGAGSRIYLTDIGVRQWPELLTAHGFTVSVVKVTASIIYFHVSKDSTPLLVMQIREPDGRNELFFRTVGALDGQEFADSVKILIHHAGFIADGGCGE